MPRQINFKQLCRDLEYYSRNLLVIKPKDAGLSYFHFNQTQKYLYYGIPPELKKNDRRFAHVMLDRGWKECDEQGVPLRQYILKARQMGISTMCEARLFQKAHTRPGTNSLVVAQDDEATTGIFLMARTYFAYLPKQLRPQIRNSSARELLFQNPNGIGGLNSWIKTQTAGWKNIGRSKTIHHLHLSEISFWPDPEAVVDGLFNAVPKKGDTSILIETTAEGLGKWAYKAWQQAKTARTARSGVGFDPVFIPWYILPEYATPVPEDYTFAPEDTDFKEEYGLSWEQVYWYNMTLAEFEFGHPANGKKFMQREYPSNDHEPWQAAGSGAFPTQAIENIFKYQVKAPEKCFKVFSDKLVEDYNGQLRVWERPIPGVQYAIGVDTAHGVGQDYSVICVLAHPGNRQVAEWADNSLGPQQLARIIETIARWYNEAVVAVEINGGSGMLANTMLYETYSNVYRWEFFDKHKQVETTKIGWETNSRTKTLLIDHSNSLYAPEVKAVVRSEHVAEQMRSLRISPYLDGGVAQYGFADSDHTGDHLMAWMIAAMCMWRKISRYDAGNDDLRVAVDVPRPAHLYDNNAIDLATTGNIRDEFYGNVQSADSWLSY